MENNRNYAQEMKAREHDLTDIVDAPSDKELNIADSVKGAGEAAVETYKAIENGVVGAYKKVEQGAVDAYHKVEDFFVEKLFAAPGETVEEAKERLKGQNRD